MTSGEYDHDAVDGATLEGVTMTEAAHIAGELGTSSVESIVRHDDRGEWAVSLEVDGGVFAFGKPTARYGIKSVTARGDPDTVTLHVVEKRR